MHIQHSKNSKGGRFFIEKENTAVAELLYTNTAEDRITIDHTEVDENLQGQGIGKELVHKAVDFARQEGFKIVPMCTYAKAIFDREPELADVL